MQAKLRQTPPERTKTEIANTVSPLISSDPLFAARAAQLIRLGILPGEMRSEDNAALPNGNLPLGTLRAHIRHYLEDLILTNKPATIYDKKTAFKKLFWFLEKKGCESCGEREIRAFLTYVKNAHLDPEGRWGKAVPGDAKAARYSRPVSVRTIEAYYVTLRTFYRWLVDCEIIDRDPTAKIRVDRPTRPLIEPFSVEQVNALARAAQSTTAYKRDVAIVVFMFDTGLRAAELCNMTLNQLDMKPASGTIKIIGKGGKERSVPFGKRCLRALRAYLKDYPPRPGLRMWPAHGGTRFGEALQPNGLRQLYERLGREANITGVRCSPHTMRHTFAINYLRRSGGDVTTLQLLMGHSKIETTLRYLRIVEQDTVGQHQKYSPGDLLDF